MTRNLGPFNHFNRYHPYDDPQKLDSNFQHLLDLAESSQVNPKILEILKASADNQPFTQSENWDGPEGQLLGFREAPAAESRHHSYRGGLVVHLLEMFALHKGLGPALFPDDWAHVSDENVLTVILCHDLHKGLYTFWEPKPVEGAPFKVTYSNRVSELREFNPLPNQHLTNDQYTFFHLQVNGVRLNFDVFQALCSQEGGWASNPPRNDSILGKYTYLLDELSGNITDRILSGKTYESKLTDPGVTPYPER